MREIRSRTSKTQVSKRRGKASEGTPSSGVSFASRHDPETLAQEQGVSLMTDFDELLGDFWPEDESAEDFIAAMREWRREAGEYGEQGARNGEHKESKEPRRAG
jgi:hypothetical protein